VVLRTQERDIVLASVGFALRFARAMLLWWWENLEEEESLASERR
jgi:hypothetical protein